jgi:tRNA(Ile)-lysidine synthase
LHACVVDHALREGSAQTSRNAAAAAEALGVSAEVLTLTWPDGANRAQSAARRARYRALCDAARRLGASVIAAGHTRDDQAETVFMRAGAGSTWRGLAGIKAFGPAPLWPEGRGLWLARPLLNARRADLRAALNNRGVGWFEDPANENASFARVRARARLAALEQAGLDPMRFAALAERLRPLADSVDAEAAALIQRAARFNEGAILIDLSAWRGGAEVRHRALAALIAAASGEDRDGPPQGLASLADRVAKPGFTGATLAGARLRLVKGGVRLERDQGALLGRADGRAPIAPMPLAANVEAVWDGRLALTAPVSGWVVTAPDPVLTREGAAYDLASAQAAGVTAAWLLAERAAHLLGTPTTRTPGHKARAFTG